MHVHKAQGLTAETSGILTGGWQTDREHTYVAVSRAREQTPIYVSREDLGQQGLDIEAVQRLADRMQRSRAQEASITKQLAEHDGPEPDSQQVPLRRRPNNPTPDDDTIPYHCSEQPATERARNDTAEPLAQPARNTQHVPIDIHEATPSDIQLHTLDLGDLRLTYSQTLYNLPGAQGEPTHVLFGGWQTDREQGFIAVARGPERTDIHISTQDRQRDIHTELTHRIEQVIERSQANTQEADPERQPVPQPQLESSDPDRYIEQAIQEEQDRQQALEQKREINQDQDRDFGIE